MLATLGLIGLAKYEQHRASGAKGSLGLWAPKTEEEKTLNAQQEPHQNSLTWVR